MILQEERELVVEYGIKMCELGLTSGTFGNVSVYNPDRGLMAICPSGMDYYRTLPEDVVVLTPDGEKVDGTAKPSSEYDLHRIFYQMRSGITGVIHTHSIFATTCACMHWSIESVHYNIAYSGYDVPCIPFVRPGTYELAQMVFDAMGDDHFACLLGNHGLLAVGADIAYALDVAEQIEYVAHLYYNTRLAGGGKSLAPEQVQPFVDAYPSYRKK